MTGVSVPGRWSLSLAAVLGRKPDTRRTLSNWLCLPLLVELLAWQAMRLEGVPGIDPSWQAGLEMALHFHLAFGRDVVFTYGPLGFLTVANSSGMAAWYGSLAVVAVLYTIVLRYLLAVAVFNGARLTYGRLPGFLLAVVGVSIVATQFADLTLVLIALVWVMRRRLAPRDELIFVGIAASAAAIESLQKVSVGATAVVMVGVYVLTANGGRRRPVGTGVAAATFVVVLVLLWLAIGQPLGALPQYIRASYEVSSGYSAAMSSGSLPGYGWALTAALVLGGCGVWAALHATRDLERRRRVGVLLLWVLFWFSAFKEGFVREDTLHLPIFFGAMVGAIFAFPLRRGYRRFGIECLALVVCAWLVIAGAAFTDVVHPWSSPSALASDVRRVVDSADRARIVRHNRKQVLGGEPLLPKGSLALLRGRTVAVYPTELDVVWAYRLDWRPLPVLQSYQAYTSWLDRLDANWLESKKAPARLIIQAGFEDIDFRFLGFDQPFAAVQILCRYRPLLGDEHYLILARASDRCSAPHWIKTVRARWGQTVHVPTPPRHSFVIGEVLGTQPAGLEKLVGVLYKPDSPGILLNGMSFRLIAGTAADGLPLVTSPGVDFPSPYGVTAQAQTLAVTDGSGQQSRAPDAITYKFFAISVARRQ